MKVDEATDALVKEYKDKSRDKTWSLGLWFFLSMSALALLSWSWDNLSSHSHWELLPVLVVTACFLLTTSVTFFRCVQCARINKMLSRYNLINDGLSNLIQFGSSSALLAAFKGGKTEANKNPLIASLLDSWGPKIQSVITSKYRDELAIQLEDEFCQFQLLYKKKAEEVRNEHPLFKARTALQSSIEYLKTRRKQIIEKWERSYEDFSWWNKLKYSGSLDLSELDKSILDMESTLRYLVISRKSDFHTINTYYRGVVHRAFERVASAKGKADEYVRQGHMDDDLGEDLLKKGFWLGTMSVPISAWSDVNSAFDVYDALRSVNGDFEGMSDSEIWWESILLGSESLAGLTSLAKGAYFEHLVSADTGGQLFEHFNHPDTDIVIDGVEFQIKATDNADYVQGVADGVPVIATSEIAEITGKIDSGYSNEDLDMSVNLALGGTVVDIGDTTADAILTSVCGFGALATLQGINHTVEKYENGGDPVEACFEGAGVAIEGTARATVNTLELGFNIVTSRPSRFVGRVLLKGFIKIDNKLMGETTKDSGVGR